MFVSFKGYTDIVELPESGDGKVSPAPQPGDTKMEVEIFAMIFTRLLNRGKHNLGTATVRSIAFEIMERETSI